MENLSLLQLLLVALGAVFVIGIVLLVLRCVGALGARTKSQNQNLMVAKRKGFGRNSVVATGPAQGRGSGGGTAVVPSARAGGSVSPTPGAHQQAKKVSVNRVAVAPMRARDTEPSADFLASKSQRSGYLNKKSNSGRQVVGADGVWERERSQGVSCASCVCGGGGRAQLCVWRLCVVHVCVEGA